MSSKFLGQMRPRPCSEVAQKLVWHEKGPAAELDPPRRQSWNFTLIFPFFFSFRTVISKIILLNKTAPVSNNIKQELKNLWFNHNQHITKLIQTNRGLNFIWHLFELDDNHQCCLERIPSTAQGGNTHFCCALIKSHTPRFSFVFHFLAVVSKLITRLIVANTCKLYANITSREIRLLST